MWSLLGTLHFRNHGLVFVCWPLVSSQFIWFTCLKIALSCILVVYQGWMDHKLVSIALADLKTRCVTVVGGTLCWLLLDWIHSLSWQIPSKRPFRFSSPRHVNATWRSTRHLFVLLKYTIGLAGSKLRRTVHEADLVRLFAYYLIWLRHLLLNAT